MNKIYFIKQNDISRQRFCQKSPAFSLIEIITVVLIVGILGSLALVRYGKAMERQRYEQAKLNLISIHSAAKLYKMRSNTFLTDPQLGNLSTLNTILGLNIINNNGDFTYSFSSSAATFSAVVEREKIPSYRMVLLVTDTSEISDTNPSCTGACP